ncbi:hypothetical protein PR048_022282 [Dryococelus australis]|uniref:Ubiquinone biosynthesis protein COQ4 homolog, mitochondrial n=1 Tax=Dryococelus australis TaxID=614101 RepID=A0ABQ9H0M2_9NEOP|nr:hypothetical protein PR048_022282 [Dryococelus australis]
MLQARVSWSHARCIHRATRALQQHAAEPFAAEFAASHVAVSGFQRVLLTAGCATMSLLDPTRADMIAILGETASHSAIRHMLRKMENHPEGREILSQRPRISSNTIDLRKLESMPEGTLGKTYWNFLSTNKVTPDSRLMVQFVDDVNLGYVIQRYREVHDLVHTLLQMPTNMLGEVTVKWVEALQTRLPMCVGGALFGAMRLGPKYWKKKSIKHFKKIFQDRNAHSVHYGPVADRTFKRVACLLCIKSVPRVTADLAAVRQNQKLLLPPAQFSQWMVYKLVWLANCLKEVLLMVWALPYYTLGHSMGGRLMEGTIGDHYQRW